MSKRGVLPPEWGWTGPTPEENAMKTLSRFVTKFTSLIVAVLSCFDRVIFKGHLALAAPCELESFVDCVLKVRRCDFMKTLAPQYSDRLVKHAQDWAHKAGRTYEYRTGQFRKDQWAQDLIRDQGISEGLVGLLCTQETCPSFALVPGPQRPRFVSRSRQQRVLYYYFLDPQFGLIHVRLQTWLSFTVQVYVNGHEWLAQQMVQKKLGFVQQHNAFTQLDDPVQAQRLADRFAQLDWPRILDRWARQVNPLLRELFPGYPVHWVVDQAEYATDLLFTSRTALAGLYRACWIIPCGRLPPRTSWASSAASGIAASMAKSAPNTKTSAGSGPGSSTAYGNSLGGGGRLTWPPPATKLGVVKLPW